MALSRISLSDLRSGRCSSAVEVKLLRFCEARSLRRGGEVTIMRASINANRVPVFRPKLAAGNMYPLFDFDVNRCAQNFRLNDSPLVIWLSDPTGSDEITEPVITFEDLCHLLHLCSCLWKHVV
ncbi:unnamed protein product [Eruca vesicaria subsp. sativa]|uniref:Uncharacterized protein n=1 Tax=Eruca vesicaria subsp. sativa TaxID=29727 RepID=A0ABC8JMW5_ERUVS|nr:unnamed protein product [Eruca vesicaria subsp. sativa]